MNIHQVFFGHWSSLGIGSFFLSLFLCKVVAAQLMCLAKMPKPWKHGSTHTGNYMVCRRRHLKNLTLLCAAAGNWWKSKKGAWPRLDHSISTCKRNFWQRNFWEVVIQSGIFMKDVDCFSRRLIYSGSVGWVDIIINWVLCSTILIEKVTLYRERERELFYERVLGFNNGTFSTEQNWKPIWRKKFFRWVFRALSIKSSL